MPLCAALERGRTHRVFALGVEGRRPGARGALGQLREGQEGERPRAEKKRRERPGEPRGEVVVPGGAEARRREPPFGIGGRRGGGGSGGGGGGGGSGLAEEGGGIPQEEGWAHPAAGLRCGKGAQRRGGGAQVERGLRRGEAKEVGRPRPSGSLARRLSRLVHQHQSASIKA